LFSELACEFRDASLKAIVTHMQHAPALSYLCTQTRPHRRKR